MAVVLGNEVIDLSDELFDAAEGAAANRLVGNQSKEALNLIQPGAVGRDEMNVPARPLGQPRFDLRMLVGAVVIDDQMNIELRWYRGFDTAQEGEEFLMTVPRLAVGEHFTAELS